MAKTLNTSDIKTIHALEQVTSAADEDEVMVYDASAGLHRKMTVEDFTTRTSAKSGKYSEVAKSFADGTGFSRSGVVDINTENPHQLVNNAKNYADKAKAYASGGTFADLSEGEEVTVNTNTSGDNALAYKNAAQAAATQAGESEDNAEAWATGGSSGTPSATNNAKYFAEQSASSATTAGTSASGAAQSAQDAAQSAQDAATSESNAASSESSASSSASAASSSAQDAATSEANAATSASSAEDQALKAEGYATGEQDGVPVSSGDYFHDNAKYYSDQAELSAQAAAVSEGNASGSAQDAATSEANAASSEANAAESESNAATSETNAGQSASAASASATSAGSSALESEGWAVGKQNGVDVDSTSPYYHNNAKYYSTQSDSSNKNDKITVSDSTATTLTDADTFATMPAGQNPATATRNPLSKLFAYISGKLGAVVKTVNGTAPDTNGNVSITTGGNAFGRIQIGNTVIQASQPNDTLTLTVNATGVYVTPDAANKTLVIGVPGRPSQNPMDLKTLFGKSTAQDVFAEIHSLILRDLTGGLAYSMLRPGDYIQLPAVVSSIPLGFITSTATDWTVEIVAVHMQDSENATACVEWHFINCPMRGRIDPSYEKKWSETELGIWLNGTFAGALGGIVGGSGVLYGRTRRYALWHNGSITVNEPYNDTSKIFLYTKNEIFGSGYDTWYAQMDIYNTAAKRIKKFNNGIYYWWTGSAYQPNYSPGWATVDDDGHAGYSTVYNKACGVAPAFCTR